MQNNDMNAMSTWLERADTWGRLFENLLLTLLFGAMVLLAAGQIVLRNVFDSGLVWAEPLLRILVLWVGMVGAIAASRENKHIAIDMLSRYLRDRWLAAVTLLLSIFTSMVCALLAWHTFRFVRDEYLYSDVEVAGLPVWLWQSVLPFGFALIAWRYGLRALENATQLFRTKHS